MLFDKILRCLLNFNTREMGIEIAMRDKINNIILYNYSDIEEIILKKKYKICKIYNTFGVRA